jgi:hypothetical protein
VDYTSDSRRSVSRSATPVPGTPREGAPVGSKRKEPDDGKGDEGKTKKR